jgi:dCTP deaminase
MERLALPEGVQAVANAKSSTGRLDLLTRTITDGGTEFDRVGPGHTGPLYAEICPRSFSVLVRPGMRLNQIRFRAGDARLSDAEMHRLHAETPLVDGPAVIDGGLAFSVDLRPETGTLTGYRAKLHTGLIDLDRIGHYPAADFWEEIHARDGHIVLDPGAFYILVSREAVHIPPGFAAEMAPFVAMRRRAARGRAACSKCAATRPRSCWNTARSSGGSSTKKWTGYPTAYTARASRQTIRGRG